ncbi:MAG: RNA polymerase sigma factor [Bacteroidetes bacterium]|nr:RNA polymerase sigma factor [Bacteroidota bacterium]
MTTQEYNFCVDQHADGVYRFILHNTRDKEFAQDIVQDAVEKMWINVGQINGEKAKSYLFTTAYHTMLDRLRRLKKQGNWNEVNEEQYSHSSGNYSGLKEVLRKALNRLPEIQRTVVMLRDYEGYSYEEIGEITGLKESQVKVYIYRARLALKEYIGKPENVI